MFKKRRTMLDNLSFRIAPEMRTQIEKIADEKNLYIAEAARLCIEKGLESLAG